MSSSVKHLYGIGFDFRLLFIAVENFWRPDKVQSTFCEGEFVLLVVDFCDLDLKEYINLTDQLGQLNCFVGILPVHSRFPEEIKPEKFLIPDNLELILSEFAFFLSTNRASLVSGVPEILKGAGLKQKDSVEQTIHRAKALFFQGHAGPFDAGFGEWLLLCTRQMFQKSGIPPFAPCYESGDCFRQKNYNRPPGSTVGRVNPADWDADLVVLDGCGVFPVPGSIYPYETSLLRAVIQGEIRTAILAHGVSSTPLFVLVYFLGRLAERTPIAKAVWETNQLRREVNSVASGKHSSFSPWTVIGNPLRTFSGFEPRKITAERTKKGILIIELEPGTLHPDTGLLLIVDGLDNEHASGWDAFTLNGNWLSGVRRDEQSIYLWVGADEFSSDKKTTLFFQRRPEDTVAYFRDVMKNLSSWTNWLNGFLDTLRKRNGDLEGIQQVLELGQQLSKIVEPVVFAESYLNRQHVLEPLDHLVGPVLREVSYYDKMAVLTLTAVISKVGARLAHLWNPVWPGIGNLSLEKQCSCKATPSAYIRKHPIYETIRMELSCPVCSLTGDVKAIEDFSNGSRAYYPSVTGKLDSLIFKEGDIVRWELEHHKQSTGTAYVQGVVFDPLGEQVVFSELSAIDKGASGFVELKIPEFWPKGLSWTVVVFGCNGSISMLMHDIVHK